MGKCEQQKAQKEGIIFAGVTDQLLNNSNFRDQVASAIKDYADNNRTYVAGRIDTSLLTSYGLSHLSTPYGNILGALLPFAAINGDIRSAIESGAHNPQAIAAAIAGGETRSLPNSTGCGC